MRCGNGRISRNRKISGDVMPYGTLQKSVTVHDLDIQPIHVAPREVRGETIVLFHQDEA
jgi:hypothetical protein